MKKLQKILIIVAIVSLFCGLAVGCKKITPQYGEKYFLCDGDAVILTSWFEFDEKEWVNENGASGKYKISGKKIKLYSGKTVAYSGTIGDGELSLTQDGETLKYRLKNESDIPTDSEKVSTSENEFVSDSKLTTEESGDSESIKTSEIENETVIESTVESDFESVSDEISESVKNSESANESVS